MRSEVKIFTIYTEPGKNPVSNWSCLAPWAVARTESAFGDSYSMYFDAVVVFFTISSLFSEWLWLYCDKEIQAFSRFQLQTLKEI